MPPIASAAWRALVLLLQSLAPGVVPLSVLPHPATRHLRAAQLASGAALLALVALLVLWLARSRRAAVGALLGLATLGAAIVCALRLPTARWPLGAGVLVVGPLLWLTLLAAARALRPGRWRAALTVLWFAGLLSDAAISRGALRRALRAPPPERVEVIEAPDATVETPDATTNDPDEVAAPGAPATSVFDGSVAE